MTEESRIQGRWRRPLDAAARVRLALGWKLALGLVLSSAVVFFAFGWWNLNLHRKGAEEMVFQSADRVSDIIRRSTQYQMMNNDREALYQNIRDIGSEPGIRRVRIINKEGRIRFSTDASEVNTIVDKQAEACYGCHSRQAPLTHLDRPDRARIFLEPGGARVLGVIRPIENRPDCASAACHAHPAGKKVLGVIDSQLSLELADAEVAAQKNRLLGFTAVALLLICGLAVLFVWAFVHKPIRALMKGTHRVADGDLAYRLEVHSADELGDLAASFNKMTAELAAAQQEIMAWARTLEERAERKGKELERAYASLLTSEKLASVGKLAATVAHEVNNPLFGILTYARLCLKDMAREGDPAARGRIVEQLGIIERESRRCGDLMKNLLTFARQAPARREPSRLNELVERALSLVRHKAEMKDIAIETRTAAELPTVECDPNQIQQVALVLMVNAVEAMGQGGSLLIGTRFDPESDQVRLQVKDTGPGMTPAVLSRIFEPFFTTKDDEHRAGLGLAVAKSIVDQHGGTIEVLSRPGQGTEFTVSLPCEGRSVVAAAAPAAKLQEKS